MHAPGSLMVTYTWHTVFPMLCLEHSPMYYRLQCVENHIVDMQESSDETSVTSIDHVLCGFLFSYWVSWLFADSFGVLCARLCPTRALAVTQTPGHWDDRCVLHDQLNLVTWFGWQSLKISGPSKTFDDSLCWQKLASLVLEFEFEAKCQLPRSQRMRVKSFGSFFCVVSNGIGVWSLAVA